MPDHDATILIVDDEEYNVDYLEQNLSDLGYRTRAAYGGREALDSVNAAAPDLILLDVMMPDIDGITVCHILKSDPGTASIPVVIMTALDGQEDRIRGIEAGADDFLTKPVDERELLARINTLLRSKKAVDRTRIELESAAAQLQDLGPRSEEVAVIAIEVRSPHSENAEAPSEAVSYLRERYVRDVGDLVQRHLGQVVSSDAESVVAILRSGDRSIAALELALAIRSHVESLNQSNEIEPLQAAIAVANGQVVITPERLQSEASSEWVTQVSGQVLEDTRRLSADAGLGTIVTTDQVHEQTQGRFETAAPEEADVPAGQIVILGSSRGPAQPVPPRPQIRQLETIFVSDIVGSTGIAAEAGDRAWTAMLEDHYRLVRSVFTDFGGQEVSTAGDGFLALFRSPASAIRAGLVLSERSAEIGLPVRVGIHTGEVERTDTDVQGIAVHLASRVANEAKASEVLVTSTTREAVAGSGLDFEPAGSHALKGIESERDLFRALA